MKRIDIDNNRLVWQLMRLIVKHAEENIDLTIPRVAIMYDNGSIQIDALSYNSHKRKIIQQAIQAAWVRNMFTTKGLPHEKGYDKRVYTNLFLTPEAIALSLQIAPEWTPPKPPKLSDRDMDVLVDLSIYNEAARRHNYNRFAMPMNVGGTNSSHHSNSLKKLCAHGYVELNSVNGDKRYPRPPSIFIRPKGSNRYGITESGKTAALEHQRKIHG